MDNVTEDEQVDLLNLKRVSPPKSPYDSPNSNNKPSKPPSEVVLIRSKSGLQNLKRRKSKKTDKYKDINKEGFKEGGNLCPFLDKFRLITKLYFKKITMFFILDWKNCSPRN